MNAPSVLDRYDLKILDALATDGRLSWRDLDEKIGLSGNACGYVVDVVWDLTGILEEYPDEIGRAHV